MDGSIALVKNWDEEYESCFGKQENLRKNAYLDNRFTL